MNAVPLDPRDRAFDGVRRVLADLAGSIDVHLDGAGSRTDPEPLHQLRIALRRSRTVVTHAKGVLPDPVRRDARKSLRDLAASTGLARDLQVLLEDWDARVAPHVDAASLERVRVRLAERRDRASDDVAAFLHRSFARDWLDGWRAWLADPGPRPKGSGRIGPVVSDRVRRAQKRVLRHGRAIDTASAPEELHRLRKDAKVLRYLIDSYGGLFPHRPAKQFISQVRALQDDLGAHQDAATQITLFTWLADDLRAESPVDPATVRAAELLREDARRRLGVQRAAFGPRFAAYDTKVNRKALKELLQPLRRG